MPTFFMPRGAGYHFPKDTLNLQWPSKRARAEQSVSESSNFTETAGKTNKLHGGCNAREIPSNWPVECWIANGQ